MKLLPIVLLVTYVLLVKLQCPFLLVPYVLLVGPRRDKNLSSGFPTKPDSNQSAQLQRVARKLKFRL